MRGLGRDLGWLWGAYAVSSLGTWLAFDAFALIAILVLDAGPAQVSVLAAAGLAAGAAVAVPLGPWVERRRKRPVMVAMDLLRFGPRSRAFPSRSRSGGCRSPSCSPSRCSWRRPTSRSRPRAAPT